MKKVALLAEKNNAFRKSLCDVLTERGYAVDIHSGEFLEATNLDGYDLVLLKTKKPKFLAAANRAKACGVKVVPDPLVAETLRNRVLCDQFMQRAGIPHPRSIYDYRASVLADKHQSFPWPAVKKPLLSSGGRGLRLICGATDLSNGSEGESDPIYLQEFIQGRHFTVYFLGKSIYAFEKEFNLGPDVAPREVPVWEGLARVVDTFRREAGVLWGDIDVVVSDSTGETMSVDPGTFPSFGLIQKPSEEIAREIVHLLEGAPLSAQQHPQHRGDNGSSNQESHRLTVVDIRKSSERSQALCKKCTARLVEIAKKKSLGFHALHKGCEIGIKSLGWIYGVNAGKSNDGNSGCQRCLRPLKNSLKSKSRLFQWMNRRVDPYFDKALEGLVSEEEVRAANAYARRVHDTSI